MEVERQNGLLLDKLSKIASRKANTSSSRALQPGEAPPPDRCVAQACFCGPRGLHAASDGWGPTVRVQDA